MHEKVRQIISRSRQRKELWLDAYAYAFVKLMLLFNSLTLNL